MITSSTQNEPLTEIPGFLQPPAEQTPPGTLRTRVLARTGQPEPAPERTRRTSWSRPLVVAASVAGLVLGLTLVFRPGDSGLLEDPAQQLGPAATGPQSDSGQASADEEPVPLDLGPASTAEISEVLASCAATHGFDAHTAEASYGRRIDGLMGPSVVVVAGTPSGDRYGCASDSEGAHLGPDPHDGTGPRDFVLTDFTDTEGAFDPATGTMEYWQGRNLIAAGSQVGSVQMRVGTSDDPGVWRTAPVHDGYAYVAAWWDDYQFTPSTGKVHVEYRAFDVDGEPIRGPGFLSWVVSNGPMDDPAHGEEEGVDAESD
jgi:hypothetical protein